MPTTKCVAFHSYKGGTGKTTIAANCAALLAKKGFKVALLDLDVYAPSLYTYFGSEPRKWLNDYLLGDAAVEDVMTDVTETVREYTRKYDAGGRVQDGGRLWLGFCSMRKEEVYKLDSSTAESSKSQLRRFILLREQLISNYDLDYIIIDTSPGIRYWSINALAVADALFLTLKMGDIDIEGTNKLASEIYSSLTKYGTRSFLLLNRVAGYCVPEAHFAGSDDVRMAVTEEGDSADIAGVLAGKTGMEVISSIPCYCDIQFSRKEFLTALVQPGHPFTKQVERLIEAVQIKV
ncbi:ATPase involved in chromosome partitioning [Candidatus Nitrososphaera evergladensis SR1]|jgi:chromosome partitioning protein|uniref:ATPase involved in chromosome partitioning n=1 Tax=Candidatus Nitrososphaera evergladensis SR1 TaxID=1459636 RepID=A0A075N1I0_9ARCH|nr:AAA family ATPase [Candidatus Nitrososphaera evergladensis]AIF85324.1 ATPase involved in chromosome partitioning [Candidatus Nitrososphaera evergladensis SR1]